MTSSPSDLFLQSLILGDSEYVWSYSRVNKYPDCKYAWLLKYRLENKEDELFFSSYGKLIHDIYSSVLDGKLKASQAEEKYLTEFTGAVTASAPSENIFKSYFSDGLSVCSHMAEFKESLSEYDIIGTEIEMNFSFADYRFTGFIDLLLRDKNGDYIIVDHKSRTLKPRSKKGTLKSDLKLDEYFRQLYIYAEAVKQKYGKYPTELWLNCFRNRENNIIKEAFHSSILDQTVEWVQQNIQQIIKTEQWAPTCDWFYCSYLCGLHGKCEYYLMMTGR